jgi:hypothetical protein
LKAKRFDSRSELNLEIEQAFEGDGRVKDEGERRAIGRADGLEESPGMGGAL